MVSIAACKLYYPVCKGNIAYQVGLTPGYATIVQSGFKDLQIFPKNGGI